MVWPIVLLMVAKVIWSFRIKVIPMPYLLLLAAPSVPGINIKIAIYC